MENHAQIFKMGHLLYLLIFSLPQSRFLLLGEGCDFNFVIIYQLKVLLSIQIMDFKTPLRPVSVLERITASSASNKMAIFLPAVFGGWKSLFLKWFTIELI